MLRLCPHHRLEKWLVIHTFYNGLLYVTKMTVDAAAGVALMNKDFKTTYALIEDMTQNHYQWADEGTSSATSPFKQEASKNEIPPFDHLSAKVDALSLKFDKLNITTLPTFISSPCGACGIIDHTNIKCQLGSAAENVEQRNFVQNNQGMRKKQNFITILNIP